MTYKLTQSGLSPQTAEKILARYLGRYGVHRERLKAGDPT